MTAAELALSGGLDAINNSVDNGHQPLEHHLKSNDRFDDQDGMVTDLLDVRADLLGICNELVGVRTQLLGIHAERDRVRLQLNESHEQMANDLVDITRAIAAREQLIADLREQLRSYRIDQRVKVPRRDCAHKLQTHHSLLALHGFAARYVAGVSCVRRWLQRRAWVRRAVPAARPSDTTQGGAA